jgi:tetratricopeptide (TPR) repeat protein
MLDRAASPQLRPSQALVTVPLGKAAADNAANPLDARTAIPLIAAQIGAGQAGAALGRALEIERRNPGVPAAHILAGDVQASLGNWQAAAAAYQKAANLDFSEATALRFARALANVGDRQGAASVIGLYLSQNPQSIPVRRLHADLHMASGRWQSAIAEFEIIRARTGNRDAALLNNLAWASINAGETAQALRYARAAYGLMPDNPAVAGTLGWAQHRVGSDRDGAVAMLEKAVRLAPLDPSMRFQLAQAYAAAGRKADARKSATTALQSNRFVDRQAAEAFLTRL